VFEQSNLDAVISELDRLVAGKTSKHLNTLQVNIMRGVWEGATYDKIAEQVRWSEAHVKSVGADLWDLMSDLLNESVTKKNFRATVERRYPDLLSLTPSIIVEGDVPANGVLEFPDGPVQLASSLYCDRPPIEDRCYGAIAQPGALVRIRAPRQMGKTSLLNRVLAHGEQLGYLTVSLNLQMVDTDILQNLDRFLQWFCARVTQKLDLPQRLSEYWDDIFGSKTSCKDYFESYLLPSCQQPLVLALDDVDTLFTYPETADGFLALLRAWYEEGKNTSLWQGLRLILVHSTDAYIPLKIHQSPFNVGLPIELPEFQAPQVMALATRHGLKWTQTQVGQLMDVLGGHPYLVRLALYQLAQPAATLEGLLGTMLGTNSPFYGHLLEKLTILEGQPVLGVALKGLLASPPKPVKPAELFQLTRMGLVKMEAGQVHIRCELYRQWLTVCL
jgi:hypothetical protein